MEKERFLKEWKKEYPELDIESLEESGSFLKGSFSFVDSQLDYPFYCSFSIGNSAASFSLSCILKREDFEALNAFRLSNPFVLAFFEDGRLVFHRRELTVLDERDAVIKLGAFFGYVFDYDAEAFVRLVNEVRKHA